MRKPKGRRGSFITVIVICVLLMLISASVIVFAATRLYDSYRAYSEGDDLYSTLREIGVKTAASESPQNENTDGDGASAGTVASKLSLTVDFDALREISPNIAAWLYEPGDTGADVSYPILHGTDNQYYVRRLPDGKYNINGSIFLDYRNSGDFSDNYSVVYGHNMKSGAMFAFFSEYRNPGYYEAHPEYRVITPAAELTAEVVYGALIDVGVWDRFDFDPENPSSEMLAYAAENTTFESGKTIEDGDRVLVFFTCSNINNDSRYIVVCKIS